MAERWRRWPRRSSKRGCADNSTHHGRVGMTTHTGKAWLYIYDILLSFIHVSLSLTYFIACDTVHRVTHLTTRLVAKIKSPLPVATWTSFGGPLLAHAWYSCLLLLIITDHHCLCLLIIAQHCLLLLFIANLCLFSLIIIVTYCICIAYHYTSLLFSIAHHCSSLLVFACIAYHFFSLLVIAPHYCSFLLVTAHRFLSLHIIAHHWL